MTGNEGETNGAVPSFVLPPVVRRILDQINKDGAKIYTQDFEYIEAVVAAESSRSLAFNLQHSLNQAFFKVQHLKYMLTDKKETMTAKELLDFLADLTVTLEQFRDSQLATMERKPVLEKFLEEMEATEQEKKVFYFALAAKTGMTEYANEYVFDRFDRRRGKGLASIPAECINPTVLNEVFNIPLLELFAMASNKSKFVKEHFFVDCKGQVLREIVDTTLFSVDPFLGLDTMTIDSFEALESDVLKKVLLQDSAFLETKAGKAVLKVKNVETTVQQEPPPVDSNAASPPGHINGLDFDIVQAIQAAGDNGIYGSVLDILSAARGNGLVSPLSFNKDSSGDEWTTVSPSNKLDSDSETGKNDGKEEDLPQENEYGPYSSDLSYLEDQVRIDLYACSLWYNHAITYNRFIMWNNSYSRLLFTKVRIMEQARLLNRMKLSLQENKFKDDQLLFREKQDPKMESFMNACQGFSFSKVGPRQRQLSDAEKEDKQRTIERLTKTNMKLQNRVQTRIAATLQKKGRKLRLETITKALSLSEFEKYVILSLLKSVIVPVERNEVQKLSASVGDLISSFCVSLESKMTHRRYFYRSGTLLREGIINISQPGIMTDLTACNVELDRRMFDFLVALDTEFGELVDGSHLYLPDVSFDDVVIPEETKERVHDIVMNMDKLRKGIREYEVQDKISYGLGQVLLFHGKPGTGKTMLANAIANKANKKVLLVNFPALGANSAGAIIKILFREASINNALLFFDECEAMCQKRDEMGINRTVNTILTEIERFEGICIMATNRPLELDEALHRRVSLAVEFRKPDHIMREKIWKTLRPPKLPIEDDVDFGLLARKFEMCGGNIKNCWISALSIMIQNEASAIKQEYLMQAAGEQVIGQLSMDTFDRRIVPTHGLDSLVVSNSVRECLNGIVNAKKASSVLFGTWGFDTLHRGTVVGVSALFVGPSGVGKTMAAEAIGFEVGSPLLVVNTAEIVSKWVGETAKNIEAIFAEAKNKDAVLVFDEAEGLFGARTSSNNGSTSRHDNMSVGMLLQHIEQYSGICVVITNMKDAIDDAFFRRFRFVVSFEEPGLADREKIWKEMVPKACPLHSDVSFKELASRFELKGGEIRQALMRAATKAALREDEAKRMIMMEDLIDACRQEQEKKGDGRAVVNMYM
ncbi:cycle protein 48 homolog AF_1297 [Seminavis robusta]|uniref:Cycle protein 48 homolog AF_1297 n=1 Tax=Seminavis robusta TaxID=568900 RepID=A0A9N8DT04_9STRA|nr:cycle protein 48 homolog AF_1297 [Seminavis robusta]|eukprot:Sro333_g119510.1 cycle protein 48 homolog AF_1297 (1159) ;mRNA; r:29389-33173